MSRRLLARLEKARRLRPGAAQAAGTLEALRRATFPDPRDLVELHDAVLFLRAYPHSRLVLKLCDEILSTFARRVAAAAASGADPSPFDHPEVSGIAGTSITTDYSYDVVRWLKKRFGRAVTIDWELLDSTDRLRALWPKFLPLLEEESTEDANVRYLDYLRRALRREDDLSWLLDRIGRLAAAPGEEAERFDAQGLSMRWQVGDTAHTRTRMRWRNPAPFFHDEELHRRGVSIEDELATPPMPIRRLSRREGEAVVEMTREATALRYREYYGFTYADPATVLSADAGRGLEIFLLGLERERRLPLRAGFAGFSVKNGVPVGYVEALAFFERVEVGFNVYYSFREGESAWIFARVLKLLNQVLGSACFSMDPYQVGHENEEAIHSGAFWFYRKLGFRSTSGDLRALTAREEKRIAADPSYRSSPSTLHRLASRNLLYEIPDRRPFRPESGIRNAKSDWDHFHIRNFSLAVIDRMSRRFDGDVGKIRRASRERVARRLGLPESLRSRAFEDLALVFDLIPDLARWPRPEKDALIGTIRAKDGRSEAGYLRRLQRHPRLRDALLRIGSRP